MVRMAAVAVIDVASGRIEALAGALSPCTRQEVRRARARRRTATSACRIRSAIGPTRCSIRPSSTTRCRRRRSSRSWPRRSSPIREVGARWLAAERAEMQRSPTALPSRDSLRGQLMRSDSARFLDRMFCADKGFAPCERPWAIQATAPAFGWNAGCDDAARAIAASATCCSGARSTRAPSDGWIAPLADRRPLRPTAEPSRSAASSARRCG